MMYKTLCTPESFYMNISHQPFDFKITFMNSKQKNTNLKGDYVLKNYVKASFKGSDIQK